VDLTLLVTADLAFNKEVGLASHVVVVDWALLRVGRGVMSPAYGGIISEYNAKWW